MALVKHIRIPDALYMQLTTSVSAYITECMKAFGVSDVVRLPNMTPNGFISPKKGIKSYSDIEAILKNLLSHIVPDAQCIQAFFCVRYKGDNVHANREFATEKWHSDIWAGDPANSFVVSIPVLGDINNGMEFAEAKKVDLNLYPNYEEGLKNAEIKYILPDRMSMGYATIFDNRCLHRSLNQGSWRISIDFRITYEDVASCRRIKDYIPISSFGNFVPEESIEECKANWQKRKAS